MACGFQLRKPSDADFLRLPLRPGRKSPYLIFPIISGSGSSSSDICLKEGRGRYGKKKGHAGSGQNQLEKKKAWRISPKKKTREMRRLSEALSRAFEVTGRQPVVDLPPLPIVSVDICFVSPGNINCVPANAHESTLPEQNSIFDHLRTQKYLAIPRTER